MDNKTYQHDVSILVEALGEATDHQKPLQEAKDDIERLAAIEKLIAYAALLTNAGTWTMTKIRRPEGS
jgi:hypothetical protein